MTVRRIATIWPIGLFYLIAIGAYLIARTTEVCR